MRAFKIADKVKIDEVTGDIIGKTLLVTRTITIQNETNSILNASVMNNHTINYSSEVQESDLMMSAHYPT